MILLHAERHRSLVDFISQDIAAVSPETLVQPVAIDFDDAWDFEEVFGKLLDFARAHPFDPEAEDYLIHITTGTHVAQICLFLLTEARYLPGRLLQTQPTRGGMPNAAGTWSAIDLDLSRYDSIANRFAAATAESTSFLKGGIATRNPAFNQLIDEIELVAGRSRAPLLLIGPTGAGKSQLARRIYELKRLRHQVAGAFVEVNCATLKGDSAMSALFGHRKGAFTGAVAERVGLLRTADKGMLFLDEIGELGLDEQAMVLRAVEEGRFLPVGSDKEAQSEFQLIAGTNRDLVADVAAGRFRDDLFARLNLWTFNLPGLAARPEDIAPNIDYELARFAEREGTQALFRKDARERYLTFATRPEAVWSGNFRDLSASITRMATLSNSAVIDRSCVDTEIARLRILWSGRIEQSDDEIAGVIDRAKFDKIDLFDRVQLLEVLRVCRASGTLSEAGRKLFSFSLKQRSSTNDADRLRKYLARFDLGWADVGR